MGSIQYEDHEQHVTKVVTKDHLNTSDDFTYLDIANLVTHDRNERPVIRYEVLLLSWLLVLLRTSSGEDASLEWAFGDFEGCLEPGKPAHRLSVKEAIDDLQGTVDSCLQVVAGHIKYAVSEDSCSAVSLIMSNAALSNTSLKQTDENVLAVAVSLRNTRLEMRLLRRDRGAISYPIRQHVETWIDMIEQCSSHTGWSVSHFLRPSARDLDTIWSWNHTLPPTYSHCMHDTIAQRAIEEPGAEAICAWDGNLTYQQVDGYSTQVAHMLRSRNVKPHAIIPVCFEKSKWTVVAILGIMKAGATFLLMDPSIPILRLQAIAEQVAATVIVTSDKQEEFSQTIVPEGHLLVINAQAFNQPTNPHENRELPVVSPSTLMYIIFTSGSTGVPKGVMISHETYTSSAIPRANAVGYARNSRVLDFASYAFDVSIDSMLCTLSQGGCLCIPSDEDRMNNINQVIRTMKITYAGLTPSVARILDKDVIAAMDCLGLGGEAVTASNVNHWGRSTRIVIGYGPCECTIGCTINSSAACGKNYVSMGQGNGAVIWVVNPDDVNQLSPVGAVGELWVEGPIVGQGYLNDPEKTASAFVNSPPWLLAGHQQYRGRAGRLYKTGDLVRYDPDGMGGFVFVGRKDTQVKLRGQRIELGEIEWQLRNLLPQDCAIIAEVVPAASNERQSMLVAFIAPKSTQNTSIAGLELVKPSSELSQALVNIDTKLSKALPRYMVPALYITLNAMPVLISGKTDRKLLRQFGQEVDLKSLEQHASTVHDRGLNERERALQSIWSRVLNCGSETIRLDDNFFALGGDSVAAMKLVPISRESGFGLTVANIFLNPALAMMAAVLTVQQKQVSMEIPPFSMISGDLGSAQLEAAQACAVGMADIRDIYPCTPTQQSLFTFSLKSLVPYTAQRVFEIPSRFPIAIWQTAWELAVAATPNLRVRVYRSGDSRLKQVEVKEDISWLRSNSLTRYLEEDRTLTMDLGQRLTRYAIVEDLNDAKKYMVWTIHHVVYDGWSEPRFLQKIWKALHNGQLEPLPSMQHFANHLHQLDDLKVQNFWHDELQGAVGAQYPHLPSRHYVPKPDSLIEHQATLHSMIKTEFTLATIIRGAWALVSAQYSGSDDVVFCETFNGRDIPLVGAESIEGPMIATTPVRIRINRQSTVHEFLQGIQHKALLRAPYQHYGMQNIRKASRDAEYACEARTGLVIQSDGAYDGTDLGLRKEDALLEALHFNPYPLMLACGITEKGFRICASFDSSLIRTTQAKRLLAQIHEACSQIASSSTSTRTGTISCMTSPELDQIWQRNSVAPLSLDSGSTRPRANDNTLTGSIYPPLAVGWVVDSREPSRLAPLDSTGELWLEGAFTSSDGQESPAWLIAGSSSYPGRTGKVYATGDLVKLQEDGSLVFVSRKDHVLPVLGHSFDINYLESQIKPFLPSHGFAATIYTAKDKSAGHGSEQKIVLLIEQQKGQTQTIQVLPRDQAIDYTAKDSVVLQMNICSKLELSLAESLKALHKFAEDTLQPHLIPFTYVLINALPISTNINDKMRSIDQLVSEISFSTLTQIRESLRTAWLNQPRSTKLSQAEEILLQAWATVLQVKPETIDVDDNFFRLGGDSVLAMKLVSNLRSQGYHLTVADLFQYTRFSDVAQAMKLNPGSDMSIGKYSRFQMLKIQDYSTFVTRNIQPKLKDPTWTIKDVLPVTDSQTLDIRATICKPRTSIQYTMLYFNSDIDQDRLINSCHELVKAHDILRTIFIEYDSSFWQVVVDNINASIAKMQIKGDLATYVSNLCAQDIESERGLGSSFMQMHYVEEESGKSCLVIALSHAQYDGVSLPRLLRDLETLYTHKQIEPYTAFSHYIARSLDKEVQKKARKYWTDLLHGSRPSNLKISRSFSAKSVFLTKQVDIISRPKEFTTATLLTSAWALSLAQHLNTSDIVFGGITSGRQIDMPNTQDVVGPCYQFTPVRITFQPNWTGTQLLTYTQSQSARSAAHDHLMSSTIAGCAGWLSSSNLDSIVNHQDWEDFDSMPFAGGQCKVDIANPHGDAAYPLKVVSFVKDSEMYAGIVGAEEDTEFLESMLDKLVCALRELAQEPEKVLLFG